MKVAVLILHVLLAARVVYALRRCRKLPLPDALGEVGMSRTTAIVLGGCVLLLNLLLCAGALLDPQHVGIFLWCSEVLLAEVYLRSVLWRIQYGTEGFVFRDEQGRLYACAWEDVLGGEKTWLRQTAHYSEWVTIVHASEFSMAVKNREGAAFLAELERRRGKLPLLRPKRGPWHGRVKDIGDYHAGNRTGLLLAWCFLFLAAISQLGMFCAAAIVPAAWALLRMWLSKRENVPGWLVHVLFLDGNYFF